MGEIVIGGVMSPSRNWAIAVLCAALTCLSVDASAAEFTGPVTHIVDGDTFDMRTAAGPVRIRFCGIDSPEHGQAGYHSAADVLQKLIGGKTVRCVQVGAGTPCDGRSRPTNRDRVVARCFIGGLDIATEMVRGRHACDWPRFPGRHYRLSAATCTTDR
jgi:micrococcal nuclease